MIKIKKKEVAGADDRGPTFPELVQKSESRMKSVGKKMISEIEALRSRRSRRDPEPGERFAIATRVTPELKRRLDAAADESGRSQAQETEMRLERSFDRTDLLTEVLVLAYGKEIAAVLVQLGTLMKAKPEAAKQVDVWLKDLVLTSRRTGR